MVKHEPLFTTPKKITKTWLTPEEAADELLVHVETIRRWLREGVIKGIKLGSGRKAPWRIYRKDWDKWLQGLVYKKAPVSQSTKSSKTRKAKP